MIDASNLARPYFSVIFRGFASGKVSRQPQTGLSWMSFLLLYLCLPALRFGITSRTPVAELNMLHAFDRGAAPARRSSSR